MNTNHHIHLKLGNPTLARLIAEQCNSVKGISCVVDIDNTNSVTRLVDCIITDTTTDISSSVPVVAIQKGTVRLGEILDRVQYTLSGREHHVEDESSSMDLGEFILYPAENILEHKTSHATIRLTDKERLVLRVLFEVGEAGLSRQDLLKAVWGYADDAETHTLETHIYRLRQKLEPFDVPGLIKVNDGIYILDIKKPA